MTTKQLSNLLDACERTKNNAYKIKWLEKYYDTTYDVFDKCLTNKQPIPNEYLLLDARAQGLVDSLVAQGLWREY